MISVNKKNIFILLKFLFFSIIHFTILIFFLKVFIFLTPSRRAPHIPAASRKPTPMANQPTEATCCFVRSPSATSKSCKTITRPQTHYRPATIQSKLQAVRSRANRVRYRCRMGLYVRLDSRQTPRRRTCLDVGKCSAITSMLSMMRPKLSSDTQFSTSPRNQMNRCL